MVRFDSLKGWLDWQESLHPLTIDLSLKRVKLVFDALHPNYNKPATITVAGTNGKGSCIATLEAIYRAQGYTVGSYTSPHILRYNERIKIDGQQYPDDLICAAFARIDDARGKITLSYFEFSTLAALDLFSSSAVDIQLLEVGLGGRLDAVNIVDADVALISSIGIDHIDWLGSTRETIGKEKAGIFRKAAPAVVGDPDPPVSLLSSAQDVNTKLYCIGKDFGYKKLSTGWNWVSGDQCIELPDPALKGEHQYRNASACIFAIKALNRLFVSENAMRQGLKNVQLKGRFQLIENKIPVLLDVGHNPEAVRTLYNHLISSFPDKRIHAIFSMMKDKDISSVINIMNPVVYDWFFAPLVNPRGATEALMRQVFSENAVKNVYFGFTGFNQAYEAAINQFQQGDLLLVFGSFFLVSDCLNEFDKNGSTT